MLILAPHHKRLLDPDAALRQFPARFDQRAAELHALGVGVKYIDSRPFLRDGGQVPVGREQKLIKGRVRHLIVLNSELLFGLTDVIDVVGGVDSDQIGACSGENAFQVRRIGRVAAKKPVFSQKPQVPGLRRSGLRERRCLVVGRPPLPARRRGPSEEVGEFRSVESGLFQVPVPEILQIEQFRPEDFEAPR
jgi:hypothetical protein